MTNLLTPKEVALMLRISPSQLCRMSKRGKIPCVNLSDSPKNATWRYDPDEIERWLEERRSGNHHLVEVKRRMKKSTGVIRGTNGANEALENKKKNSEAHGTEHPVNAENNNA